MNDMDDRENRLSSCKIPGQYVENKIFKPLGL